MDEAHKATDEALEALEARIAEIYATAETELREKIDAYFAQFAERDKAQQNLLKAGKITEQEYLQWRLAQIGRGKRFEALADEVAYRMTNANEVATAYVNDQTPNIFSLNYNHTAYTIEQVHGNVGFTLMNEDAVRRLIVEEPDLLPKRRVDAPVDHAWNRKRFIAEITSGIIQGESIKKLADRVESLSDASRAGAVRNARTAVTYAQNLGSQKCAERAAKMGIRTKKRWNALRDLKVRDTHARLDGQIVNYDEPFEIDGQKIMFPGDKSARPDLVWGCRCRREIIVGENLEAEPHMMRIKNPVTGKYEVVEKKSYVEWEKDVRVRDPNGFDIAKRKANNEHSDRQLYDKYKAELGKNAPKTFEAFQELKYNSGDWEMFKDYAKAIRTEELTTLANFKLYKKTSMKIDNMLVGIETADGIVVTSKSKHFIARTIGSVKQKRSGVDIETSLIALRQPDEIIELTNSRKYILNGKCIVSVNPNTGKLIQVNPYSGKKGKSK